MEKPVSHEGGTEKYSRKDIHPAIAIFRVWIRTLRGLRYPGIGSLSEYEPILKIFAIYVKFSAVQSIASDQIGLFQLELFGGAEI